MLLAFLLGGARASCMIGLPTVAQLDAYAYVSDATVAVQLPVTCTPDTPPGSVSLSSAGGQHSRASDQWQGILRAGSDTLNYYVPGYSQLRVQGSTLNVRLVIPAGQWGAPTGTYSDTLDITLSF
ncbi:hypothetical protein D3875_04250 [Deinococcus cavernae]|uniref:Spore coat protein U domain-containing protein n=1 Tax=Deinococcus cavernae TaxID=2320857 RepID=A0A418VEJ9_9DEIO|nr:hypothetical protein [Deinococcus cavernae]RJF74498.1 hypothetical protein D3875_04250 [Deinococcus cavernae]